MALALLVFLGSGGTVLFIQGRYQASRQGYTQAAEDFTAPAGSVGGTVGVGGSDGSVESGSAVESGSNRELPPITVDFARLQEVNPDIRGWLYCPDTVINYPVMQGSDNDFYLGHNYTGAQDQCGSIFLDAKCASDFSEANSILYGHSMRDGSMFGKLDAWRDPAYYAAHPVMWLLTPEKNYRVVLFSGYTTSSDSGTYTIIHEPGEDLDQYLADCRAVSGFQADVVLDGEQYVVLSTCAYDFAEARYVLHGKLEPLD